MVLKEFTCMEIYVAYKDYNWMMTFTENMIEKICMDVNGTTEVKVGDNIINFKAPFKRVTMLDSIKEFTGYDLTGMNEEQIREVCQKLNMEIDDTMGKGKLIDEIFGEFCEGNYIQPTFITDYPIEMSPLTKRHRNNPDLTERFELMVNGKEADYICKAMDELDTFRKNPATLREYCSKLHDIENQADDVYELFITKLFEEEKDCIEIIKIKEIMQILEKTTDSAEYVGKILRTLIVKYA
jgi:lysyl-tRNA synthetase class II